MANPSKNKGTSAESALVAYLREHGYPATERRALRGAKDGGDIAWLPWIALEVKNYRTPHHQAWLREVEQERANLGALIGVVAHKPHGVGLASQGDWHAVMTFDTLLALVARAGGG